MLTNTSTHVSSVQGVSVCIDVQGVIAVVLCVLGSLWVMATLHGDLTVYFREVYATCPH